MKDRKIITQVGSLPYEDISQAVDYSLGHDIPFLPELPNLGDAMLTYIKNPGRLSCLKEFKRHRFSTVKIQCIGPATLIMSGYGQDEAIQRIYEHVAAIMDGLQAQEVILFLDEPALGQAGFDFDSLWGPVFSSFDIISGVHTCGNMDWDKMFKADIDIISFDSSQFDITRYSAYRGDKRISWGVSKIEDIKDFRAGDLITLPCGMGSKLYSVEDCQPKLDLLKDIAGRINGQT